MRPAVALFLIAVPLLARPQEGGIVFEKAPVHCAAIDFSVRIPAGWKVVQDETGLSARGKDGGFVITREPFLGEAKTFAGSWGRELAAGGIITEVKAARAGRYKGFRAEWEPADSPGLVVEVYRLHVPELEMLYNLSFSIARTADKKAIVAGALKSFKVTAKARGLELQKTTIKVGEAGAMHLPLGCVAGPVSRRQRGDTYVKTRQGYAQPKVAVTIKVAAVPAQALRLPTGGDTSKPESLNDYFLQQFGLDSGWEKKPRSKPGSFGGLKGAMLVGRMRGKDGDAFEVCLWSGKGKRFSPTILIVAHEREVRLYKNYFKTILKSFKARK